MGMEPAFLVTLPTPLTTTGAAGNPCPFSQKAGPVDDYATALIEQNRALGELLRDADWLVPVPTQCHGL
jgi:hypothetical protein